MRGSVALRYPRNSDRLLWTPTAGDGCVLWLPMQDDPQSATVRDRSGQGNNGTITGATWTVLPSGLWCLGFDGTDDYVDCGSDASLNITDKITVLCWFYLDNWTHYRNIITKRDLAGDNGGYFIQTAGPEDTNKLQWGVRVGASSKVVTSTNAISGTTWVLLAGVYDRVNVNLYVNAAVAATPRAETGAIDTDSTSLKISNTGDLTLPSGCRVALPRVYNRALSALEILGHYNRERHLFGV